MYRVVASISLSLSLSSNPKSPTAAFSARKPPPRLTHHQGWQALPHLSSRTALEKPTGALALSVSQNHRTRRVDSDPKTGLRLGPPEAMQVLSNTRRLSRVLKSPIFIFSERLLAPDAPLAEAPRARLQWRKLLTTLSPQPSGITRGCCLSPTEQHSMMISLTERKENHSIDSTRVRRLQSGRSSLGEFVAVASYGSRPWDGEFHRFDELIGGCGHDDQSENFLSLATFCHFCVVEVKVAIRRLSMTWLE
ncbi:uncharacterized protein LOC133722991 [Rosa rugosa]|uniref:uncharacterized protein LOC133722991 n=1 Tax=Rosa rugosa TaxID=74645 RepID=UPI002B40122B|nr:uncharacterized protein LOC133722991 [Rosa rugosa]